MSKRELVSKAFNNQVTERVPVGFWFHFAQDAFNDPSDLTIKRNIDGHQKFVDEFDPDFLKLMSDGFFAYPNESISKVKNPEDLNKVTVEDVNWWIDKQVELVKELTGRFGKDRFTFYNIFSPATYLSILFESAGTALTINELFRENPTGLRRVLGIIGKDIAELSKRVIKEGRADGIYLSVRSIDGIKKEEYLENIAPWELTILDTANKESETNILHICGYAGHKNDITTFVSYPAKVINWPVVETQISLEEGKKLFDGKAVIGGFNNTDKGILYKGSKDEIQKETVRILKGSGKVGVILGADCTIPSDIALEHLEWVREIAK